MCYYLSALQYDFLYMPPNFAILYATLFPSRGWKYIFAVDNRMANGVNLQRLKCLYYFFSSMNGYLFFKEKKEVGVPL